MTVTQARKEIGMALAELWEVIDAPFDDFLKFMNIVFKESWYKTTDEKDLKHIKYTIEQIKIWGPEFYLKEMTVAHTKTDKYNMREIDVYHHTPCCPKEVKEEDWDRLGLKEFFRRYGCLKAWN